MYRIIRVDGGMKVCTECVKGCKYKHGHDVTCPSSKYYDAVVRVGGIGNGNSNSNNNIKDKDKDKAEDWALKKQEAETKKKDNLARSLKGVNEEKQAAEKKKQEKKAEKEKTEKEEKEQATEKKKQEANARA